MGAELKKVREQATDHDGLTPKRAVKLRQIVSQVYEYMGDPWTRASIGFGRLLCENNILVDTDPKDPLYELDHDAAAALEPRFDALVAGWNDFRTRQPELAAALVDEVYKGLKATIKEYSGGGDWGGGFSSD